MGRGVEVHAINDPLQQRVFICDGAHMRRQPLADFVRELSDL
jgi:hypothetical protein